MVCTGEKGYATFQLSVSTPPGHASNPPAEGCLGILAKAVSKLENKPMPRHFTNAGAMLGCLAGGFSGPYQLLMSNLWLFGPLLSWVFSLKPVTAAIVRTTTALTVFHSGSKSNVLPG
jgi:carboxypeptidase PM20D1